MAEEETLGMSLHLGRLRSVCFQVVRVGKLTFFFGPSWCGSSGEDASPMNEASKFCSSEKITGYAINECPESNPTDPR